MTDITTTFSKSETDVVRLAIAFVQIQSHRNLLGLTEQETKDLEEAQKKLSQNW